MLKYLFLSAVIASVLVSCSDDDNSVNVGNDDNNNDTVITKNITDIKPDTLISRYLYYSFDSDSFIPASRAETDDWDIRLPYLYRDGRTRSIDIFLNRRIDKIPVYKDSIIKDTVISYRERKTLGLIVDTTFDFVQSAPSDAFFKLDDTATIGRIIPMALDGTGMFTYVPTSRTINPVPQKTLLVKTRAGNFIKFQVLSLYKGQPAVPTMMSELGYYSFRYAKSSTRNLRTN